MKEIKRLSTYIIRRIATSFARFTALPLTRIFTPSPAEDTKAMVFWPFVGWLSGAVAAVVILLLSPWTGLPIAVGVAIGVRCILLAMRSETGIAALFSAIVNKKRGTEALEHMEQYAFDAPGATIVAIAWALLWWSLSAMDAPSAAITIIAADAYARMISGQSIQMMPCASVRASFVTTPPYSRLTIADGIVYFIVGILPLAALLWISGGNVRWDLLIFAPCLVMYFMYLLIWRRFGGYTDKTISAMQLAAELVCCAVVALSI